MPLALSTLFKRRNWFANEAKAPDSSWVQLAPYGDFPNPKGFQRVRHEDGVAIANSYNSIWNPGTSVIGLPFYIGHPDHESFKAEYKDKRAVGRVKKVEDRYDANCSTCNAFCNEKSGKPCPNHGIFAHVRWNDDGKKLIENEAFHGHSVNWAVEPVGKFFRPRQIKSVGFTNEPNIPVAPITIPNEQPDADKAITDLFFVNAMAAPMPYAPPVPPAGPPVGQPGPKGNMPDKAPSKLTDYIKKFLGVDPEHEANEDEMVNQLTKRHAEYANMANDFADFKKKTGDAADKMKSDCAANEKAVRTVLEKAGVKVDGEANVFVLMANEFDTRVTQLAEKVTVQLANEKKAREEAEAKAKTIETTFANERNEAVKLVLDERMTMGVVTKADREKWEKEFANGFKPTLESLLKASVQYRTESRTKGLGQRNSDSRDRTTKVIEMVNERIKANEAAKKPADQCTYDAAFAQIKAENPALFSVMVQPETATK